MGAILSTSGIMGKMADINPINITYREK